MFRDRCWLIIGGEGPLRKLQTSSYKRQRSSQFQASRINRERSLSQTAGFLRRSRNTRAAEPGTSARLWLPSIASSQDVLAGHPFSFFFCQSANPLCPLIGIGTVSAIIVFSIARGFF